MLKLRNKEIHISQGDDAAISIALTQNGEPYTLQEGDEVIFRLGSSSNGIMLEKSLTNSGNTFVTLFLSNSDTANMNCGLYIYDLAIHYADGTQSTLVPPTLFEVMDVMWYESVN